MPSPQPLQAGASAPKFTFTSDSGKRIDSTDLNGPALLYFYPKDDTPGCTKQACGLRDLWQELQDAGLAVIGVSKDSEASHAKFQAKYSLPFPLIADSELQLAQAYGVFGEKKFMGRIYDGVHRMSFLISANGHILKTYEKVKPAEHAAQILKDLKSLYDENTI